VVLDISYSFAGSLVDTMVPVTAIRQPFPQLVSCRTPMPIRAQAITSHEFGHLKNVQVP
jgi:hypothetical protein